jgi:hypothetical protein
VLAEEDESRRVEVLLQLERQDLELVDRACFQTYPLAGEAFCGDYQRTGGDDHRVSIMVARCGGDAAWRRYSPLHRVAAFLSQQLQELQASRVQPDALLSAHLQHKAVVLREYPYLSHIDEGALFRPFRWPDANGMREIPISEWTPMMRALVLEREIALWQGLTIGWHVFHGTASDRFCSPQVSPPSLNEAVVREPASE